MKRNIVIGIIVVILVALTATMSFNVATSDSGRITFVQMAGGYASGRSNDWAEERSGRIVFTKTSTIGEYELTTEVSSFKNSRDGCFGKYTIRKNGNVIKNIDYTEEQNIIFEDGNLEFKLHSGDYWNWQRDECERIENDITLRMPKDSVEMEIQYPGNLTVNETGTIKVTVRNGFSDMQGELIVEQRTAPSILGFSPSSKTVERDIDVPTGSKKHEFDIPKARREAEMTMDVTLELFYDTSKHPSLNTFGTSGQDESTVTKTSIVGLKEINSIKSPELIVQYSKNTEEDSVTVGDGEGNVRDFVIAGVITIIGLVLILIIVIASRQR